MLCSNLEHLRLNGKVVTQIRWGGKWVHLAYIWIVSHLSAKNYRNLLKFDEVLTKTNLLSFFLGHGVCDWYANNVQRLFTAVVNFKQTWFRCEIHKVKKFSEKKKFKKSDTVLFHAQSDSIFSSSYLFLSTRRCTLTMLLWLFDRLTRFSTSVANYTCSHL